MNDIKELWQKACAFDHIPTNAKFVEFSTNNPYVKDYNAAIKKKQETVIGKITRFENQGTIIVLYIETDSEETMIPFDHRCFQHFVEDNPDLKIGDVLEYNKTTKTITLEGVLA